MFIHFRNIYRRFKNVLLAYKEKGCIKFVQPLASSVSGYAIFAKKHWNYKKVKSCGKKYNHFHIGLTISNANCIKKSKFGFSNINEFF